MESKYYLKFSKIYVFNLLFRLFPYYLRHFFNSPHCKDVPDINYKCLRIPLFDIRLRNRRALYHAIRHILLDGYAELTELKLMPATGQLFFFALELTVIFDEHLEKRLETNTPLDLAQILDEPIVKQRRKDFIYYLQQFGREEIIATHLQDLFVTYYDTYTHILLQNDWQFEEIYKAVQLDNGLWLRSLMEVICLFNEHDFQEAVLENFYAFGMVGKLADDMVDLVRDFNRGRPNLLYALICQNEAELANFQYALENRTRLTQDWWFNSCPRTYEEYFRYVEKYYDQITSQKLKLACDLLMFPAIMGYDYDPGR